MGRVCHCTGHVTDVSGRETQIWLGLGGLQSGEFYLFSALLRLRVCKALDTDTDMQLQLAGGVFSGKYKSKGEIPTEGRFADQAKSGKVCSKLPHSRPLRHCSNFPLPRILASDLTSLGSPVQMYRERYFHDSTFAALSLIEPVVKQHNLTLVETALRWCVHHSQLKLAPEGGNDGVIIGVSSFGQLETNLRDLEKGPLPAEVVAALDRAWEEVFQYKGPSYWR